jgi:prepilin-type processing-associated H-X9-DG protein
MGWIPLVLDNIGLKWNEEWRKRAFNFCPVAKDRNHGPIPIDARYGGTKRPYTMGYPGSYGINAYIYDRRPAIGEPGGYNDGKAKTDFWNGTINVKNASEVPMFADCAYGEIWPGAGAAPPSVEDEFPTQWWYGSGVGSSMFPICINRHNGGINIAFVDESVRKIRLKELWTFKWSRTFNTRGPWTEVSGTRPSWPAWMKGF